MIQDFDGKFVGRSAAAAIVPDNRAVGNGNSACTAVGNTRNPSFYICDGTDISVVEFESLAADRRKRFVHPVTVKTTVGETDQYSVSLNTMKEWKYEGFTPKNRRNTRFVGLAGIGEYSSAGPNTATSLNITYWAENPGVIKHRI